MARLGRQAQGSADRKRAAVGNAKAASMRGNQSRASAPSQAIAPSSAVLVEPLLVVRRVLREQIDILHRRLLVIVRDDAVCRRLMTVPGVGPVVALTYRATVDVPARFGNSKAVGAVFGLTPSKYQSGEINRTGAISKCGDEMCV